MYNQQPPKPSTPAFISVMLPLQARSLLITAASIDPKTPVGLSPERVRVLDSAIERVKNLYPQFFRR